MSRIVGMDTSNEVGTDWLRDTAISNFCKQDTLLDWLDAFPMHHGFKKDSDQKDYNPTLSFASFVAGKTMLMCEKTVQWWAQRVASLGSDHSLLRCAVSGNLLPSPITVIVPHATSIREVSSQVFYHEQTEDAIKRRIPIICRPVLHNHENKTICSPTYLIRSDWLHLCVEKKDFREKEDPCDPNTYVVVNQKFRQLRLLADGKTMCRNLNNRTMRTVAHVQNAALSTIQGPGKTPFTYILGRSCIFSNQREDNAMFTFGRFPADDIDEATRAAAAFKWLRLCHEQGLAWQVVPRPSHDLLFPNMNNQQSGAWSVAKKQIAKEIKEITGVWNCGVAARNRALDQGISRYDDPRLCVEILGITGKKRMPIVAEFLAINQQIALTVPVPAPGEEVADADPVTIVPDAPVVSPPLLKNCKQDWRNLAGVWEYGVDFETASNLNDPMTKFPRVEDTTAIHQIGCSHIDMNTKQPVTKIFRREQDSPQAEETMIDSWFAWMDGIHLIARDYEKMRGCSTGISTKPYRCICWSAAEVVFLETAFNSAAVRLNRPDWIGRVKWLDLMFCVKSQPIFIRGCLNFGLKSFAKALYSHGLINVIWPESQVDGGMSAMMACIRASEESQRKKITVGETRLCRDAIEPYLRVDVEAMMAIAALCRNRLSWEA